MNCIIRPPELGVLLFLVLNKYEKGGVFIKSKIAKFPSPQIIVVAVIGKLVNLIYMCSFFFTMAPRLKFGSAALH